MIIEAMELAVDILKLTALIVIANNLDEIIKALRKK